jgi:pyruvate dehydrogenase E2 component (dihydrolipoamide acetyltransferase)
VTGDDVLRAAAIAPVAAVPPAGLPGTGPVTATVVPPGPATPTRPAGDQAERRRTAMAALMARSWQEIPHYHLATRADVSVLTDWLTRTNETRPLSGRLLAAAVLLRATALAAARHPAVNGWYRDGTFVPAGRVDLGVVVALRGGGLLAPTITDAGALPVDELMTALRDVVGRARRGRLRSSDTAPASITVTNLGELGVDEVHGVIHPPQVALVGIGAVHEEAWASAGMIAARPVVHLSLAGDHRVSDGLTGAAFLSDLVRILDQPELW